MTQVFVDLDGVLADFDTHHENVFGYRSDKLLDNVDWQKVAAVPNFYADIPPMQDMHWLWEFVSKLTPQPIILTGVPYQVHEAVENKTAWVHKHLGPDITVQCCKSKDKCLFAKPGDILIDDWEKYKQLWIDKGGRWITHTSAKSSIAALVQLGIGSLGHGLDIFLRD